MVGLYSLWVKEGEILLLGAVLRASSALYHVAVPVIHAIPSITAVGDSAEVEISTNDDGIRYLGPVSNHFAGIWEPSLINTNLSLSFNVVSYCKNNWWSVGLTNSTARLPYEEPPRCLERAQKSRPGALAASYPGSSRA